MAMQLVAYEIRMAWLDAGERLPEPPWDRPWADSAGVEGMLEHLDSVLESTGFLDLRDPGLVPMRLRRLFFRTRLDQVEVNILRGLFGRIERIIEQGGVVRREKSDPGRVEGAADSGAPGADQS
jgi:tRNA C32,U32 (ribose-2'-O)-methylase TrmJ